MMEKKWIAMFSQTGSEIIELSKMLGRKPDVIITNNSKRDYIPEIIDYCDIFAIAHSEPIDYMKMFSLISGEKIITLHGWLRILPKDVCESFEIFNGHPGLITMYPELKGLDQQKVPLNKKGKYPFIGSVVHRVAAEVDSGEVLYSCYRENKSTTEEEIFKDLRRTSIATWERFFSDYLQNNLSRNSEVVHWMYEEES